MILNYYEPNDRPSKYIRQILTQLRGKMDMYTIIVGKTSIEV